MSEIIIPVKGPTYYTGVGSRETPKEICALIELIGVALYREGLCLRSGGADGADQAFESQVPDAGKTIYLPWREGDLRSCEVVPPPQMLAQGMMIAAGVHPRWSVVSEGGRKLLARDVFQVLGDDLQTPSRFVLYWAEEDATGKVKGGTACAVNVARNKGIPAYNLAREKHLNKALDLVMRHCSEQEIDALRHSTALSEIDVRQQLSAARLSEKDNVFPIRKLQDRLCAVRSILTYLNAEDL